MIMDDDAKINENGGKYQGMDRYEARKAIVADLEAGGCLGEDRGIQPQRGRLLPLRHHGGAQVTSAQWFVKMEPLAKAGHSRWCKEGRDQICPRAL